MQTTSKGKFVKRNESVCPRLQRYHNCFPENFLNCEVAELHQILKGPSLLQFEGQSEPPLFVCTLLHGNEHTGFLAMQRLFREFTLAGRSLPRSLCLFIGNTAAAEKNLRVLPNQTDFNRIWSGLECPEKQVATEIRELIQELRPFAAVDLHNNTGLNPHYACVADMLIENLNLAALFSRHVMIFRKPESTFGVNMAKECPAVTIEAGLSSDARGVDHVAEYLRALLCLRQIPSRLPFPHELDLYENIACVKLRYPHETIMAMLDEDSQFEPLFQEHRQSKLWLRNDIDLLNFSEMTEPVLIGKTPAGAGFPFIINCLSSFRLETDYAKQFFIHRSDGYLFFAGGALPSMLTPRLEAMQLDCVCYLMKRFHESLHRTETWSGSSC